jgi:hypothetical protein
MPAASIQDLPTELLDLVFDVCAATFGFRRAMGLRQVCGAFHYGMEEAMVRAKVVEMEYERHGDKRYFNKRFLARYLARRIVVDKEKSEIELGRRLYSILAYLFRDRIYDQREWIHSLETILYCFFGDGMFRHWQRILSKDWRLERCAPEPWEEDLDILRAAALLDIEEFHDDIIAKASTESYLPRCLGSVPSARFFFLSLAVHSGNEK